MVVRSDMVFWDEGHQLVWYSAELDIDGRQCVRRWLNKLAYMQLSEPRTTRQ